MPGPRPIYWIDYQRGPAWPLGQPGPQPALQEHQIYLQRLMEAKTLLFAGLFQDDVGGGIAVLDMTDEAMARRIMEEDPGIQTGILTAKLRPWLMVFNAEVGTSPFSDVTA